MSCSSSSRPQRGAVGARLAVALAVIAWAGLTGLFLLRRDLPRLGALLHRPDRRDLIAGLVEAQPTRPIEPRLSRPAADRHRPYDVALGARARAPVPYATLAGLEKQGDEHGLATAHLLAGDTRRAAQHLDRLPAPASADVENDRAALALLAGDPEAALGHIEAALAARPGMTQALWNRGLAERALGLESAAAAAFEEVAKGAEQGWSADAAALATALRRGARERLESWTTARAAGEAMRRGGPVMAVELVRRHPGVSRLFFYDAARTAPDRARVLSLLPVARELDRASGSAVLAGVIARTSGADFAVRRPLAVDYQRMFDGGRVPGLSARALAAGQIDLALGAMLLGDEILADLEQYRRMARLTADPWFAAIAEDFAAQAEAGRGDLLLEEKRLRDALEACNAAGIDYRCHMLTWQLEHLYIGFNRPIEARAILLEAWQRSRASGEWGFEIYFLRELAITAHLTGRYAVNRAYLREAQHQEHPDCLVERFVAESHVELAMRENRIEEAKRRVGELPTCGEPLTFVMATYLAALAHFGLSAAEEDRARAALASFRARGNITPAERVAADVTEARIVELHDPRRSRAMLETVIVQADMLHRWDADAQRTRWDAFAALVDQAGAAGRLDEAIGLLEREAGLPRQDRCTLGLSLDLDRLLVVARGVDGKVIGRFEPHHPGAVVVAEVVGPEVVEALRRCETVDVLARPPFQGRSDLLPRALAWRYRVGRPRPGVPPGLAPKRVVISGVEPPPSLGLPPLRAWTAPSFPGETTVTLDGPAANPGRVLAELAGATEVEFHTHGLVDSAISDVSLLVLSPGRDGQYALSARQVRDLKLLGAPLVILAACRAAAFAPYVHESWSLPAAFLDAGAQAVLASPSPLSDAEAGPFFAGVRARIHAGDKAVVALRDERQAWLARDPRASVGDVLIFE